jgi:hypothetical protein
MINYKQLKETAEQLKTKEYDYNFVAMRVVADDYDDYNTNINDILPESHVWDDGNYTDATLNGTCGININAKFYPEENAGYSGNRILVIAGNYAEDGQDIGEIIIRDAKVIDILNF